MRDEMRDDEDEEEGGWGEQDYLFIIHSLAIQR